MNGVSKIGYGSNLLNNFNKENSVRFYNFCKMTSTTFNQLVKMIGPSINNNTLISEKLLHQLSV